MSPAVPAPLDVTIITGMSGAGRSEAANVLEDLGFFVIDNLPPALIGKVAELARRTPEVVECHRITGEDCFFLKLHLRSIDELEEILDRFTPYGRTTTSIVHSSPVERPLPPLR
jgi:RNase adaptor protein for sRNA GlmZ degradation